MGAQPIIELFSQCDSQSRRIACCHTVQSLECSYQQLPLTANGYFPIPQELYQAKLGSCEAGGFVNRAVSTVQFII